MPTFTRQNWHFKKRQRRHFKPTFWIDICMNIIYLQYFYKIHPPSMFLYQVAIFMLICAKKKCKNKATLSFRLVPTAFADLCACPHRTTWKFVWTINWQYRTILMGVLSLNFVKKTSLYLIYQGSWENYWNTSQGDIRAVGVFWTYE